MTPGALLEYKGLGRKDSRNRWLMLSFKEIKENWATKTKNIEVQRGDIFMVIDEKVYFTTLLESNGQREQIYITIRMLFGEKLVLATWNYTTYGFSSYFNLAYTPEQPTDK